MKPNPSEGLRALAGTLGEDGPACRRALARLRLCRMAMRRQGKLYAAGYEPPAGSSVQRLWREAGWRPSRWVWNPIAHCYLPVRDRPAVTPIRARGKGGR